jgi:hypothetical protein
MALSTVKIVDTIEWVKKLSFGRNPVIGNNLEPALSNANMVMQTILGPPFAWWWNAEDLVFTCNPTLNTASVTNVVVTANVATITCANTFAVNQQVIPSALVTATFLNGQIMQVATASATQFTANVSRTTYGTAGDTGTITAATTQDYAVSSPEFSHIELATIQDINVTPAKWYELKEVAHLSLDTIKARPQFIHPISQDVNGNVTFRLMPAPDKAYPVVVNVMKAPTLLNSVNSTWAPIPDYMQYVYDWGFLALTWAFADDPRFAIANQKFTAGLIARATGLTDGDRNIFLNTWSELTGRQQAESAQGRQARVV